MYFKKVYFQEIGPRLENSHLIGHSHGIWNNKDVCAAGHWVSWFQICFLILFPNKHKLCVCGRPVLLHVLQTMTQTSTRSHGSGGQAGAQTQEVHTDTTANKQMTTNPQRMQKAKIKSSCDSRNEVLIFPLSQSEFSVMWRPNSWLLTGVQLATYYVEFALQK